MNTKSTSNRTQRHPPRSVGFRLVSRVRSLVRGAGSQTINPANAFLRELDQRGGFAPASVCELSVVQSRKVCQDIVLSPFYGRVGQLRAGGGVADDVGVAAACQFLQKRENIRSDSGRSERNLGRVTRCLVERFGTLQLLLLCILGQLERFHHRLIS